MELDEFLQKKLKAIHQSGRMRSLISCKPLDSRLTEVNGRSLLQFSSNDYLGLSLDKRVAQASFEAAREYGAGATGSRLISGSNELVEELEKQIATLKNTKAALFFNSGYAANLAVISTLLGPADVVFSDSNNHSSILSGIKLSGAKLIEFEHLNLQDLQKKLTERKNYRNALIISESVFSMDGGIASIRDLSSLAKENNCWLMIDEAHSFGVYGKEGRGLVSENSLENDVEIQMGTFSKALGLQGAFVAGSEELINYLIQRARTFIYSTASSPLIVGGLLKSLEICKTEEWRRQALHKNAKRIREFCNLNFNSADCTKKSKSDLNSLETEKAFSQVHFEGVSSNTIQIDGEKLNSQIICITFPDNQSCVMGSDFLWQEGIWLHPIRTPTVKEPCLRIVPNALHTNEDLEALFGAFLKLKQNLF